MSAKKPQGEAGGPNTEDTPPANGSPGATVQTPQLGAHSDPASDGRLGTGGTLLLVGGVLVSLAAIVFGVVSFIRFSDVPVTRHGYIAMALGSVLSALMAFGLMALVFHSHRHGLDEIDVRDE